MTVNDMHLAPRCGARAKTTRKPCCAPAMSNGRCRMHGGKSPGAPIGNTNNLRHGMRSAETIKARKFVNDLLRENRAILRELT